MIVREMPIYSFLFDKLCKNKSEYLKNKFYINMPSELFSDLKEEVILSFYGALEIRIIKRS